MTELISQGKFIKIPLFFLTFS